MEKEIKYPPFVYSLKWNPDDFSFLVSISKESIFILKRIFDEGISINTQVLDFFRDSYLLNATFKKDIKCFCFLRETKDSFIYTWTILSLKKHSDEACPDCTNPKSFRFKDENCWTCRGSKKEIIDVNNKEFKEGFQTLVALNKLVDLVVHGPIPFNTKQVQLYLFNLDIKTSFGSTMGAWLDRKVLFEILSKGESHFLQARNNMSSFYSMLFMDQKYSSWFRVEKFYGNRFFLEVPGSATTLAVEKIEWE